MNLGTLFGLAGMVIALISLVYVRTQAAASHAQAKASAEQTRIAQRVASLDLSMRLADRTAEVRRQLLAEPKLLDAYLSANPALREAFARIGGLSAVIALRSMLDAMQDIYQLRKEGVVNDGYWLNYLGAFLPYTRMPEMRALFDNAVERGLYEAEFLAFCAAFFEGREPVDPARIEPGKAERPA